MNVFTKNVNIDGYELPVMVINLKNKTILSIPSQIGCPIQCNFCISNKSKFVRNLKSEEMKKLIFSEMENDNNTISFTGEGEPILNITNIINVIDNIKTHKSVSNFRICMSGIKSENLSRIPVFNNLNLQISLHSPDDLNRKKLIPHTQDIQEILTNVRKNSNKFQEIAINYVLIKNFNDTSDDVIKLSNIIDKNWIIKINPLLHETNDFKDSNNIEIFTNKLKSLGFNNIQVYKKIGSTIKNELFQHLSYKNEVQRLV